MAKQIKVPAGLYWQSRGVKATEGLWRRLGNLETSIVADELDEVAVKAPIYVTSLARAGTTIVTEMLNEHPLTTAHRYSDFPWVWTPYWRNYLRQRSQILEPKLEERAHKDRIMISQESPEAVEEVLWNHFFPQTHDPAVNNVLDAETQNPAFEKYYNEHQRKLLLVRNASRYLAKGNYNIGRLAYIHKLYPDAKFIIPIRHPVNHIASLAKQHKFFMHAAKSDPRIGEQLQLAGHWEFGPGRRAVNYADENAIAAINSAWSQGQEVTGLAWLWQSSYTQLYKQISANRALKAACFIFKYEDLCANSASIIDAMLNHCQLEATNFTDSRNQYIAKLQAPDYYQPDFSPAEMATIKTVCTDIAANFGYETI